MKVWKKTFKIWILIKILMKIKNNNIKFQWNHFLFKLKMAKYLIDNEKIIKINISFFLLFNQIKTKAFSQCVMDMVSSLFFFFFLKIKIKW